MKITVKVIVIILICCILPFTAWAKDRRVVILIDTSGSMSSSDKPRYAVQLSKIISELVEAGDELSVVRLPENDSCSAGPNSSLALPFNSADLSGFKEQLDE
ncbi:MAG TPA: hypothetical protein VJL89_08010, partial [Thermodesulfovibrionia bacterium]|nr:hypothetical protein [Thermodesulfovibrionia bacterium]